MAARRRAPKRLPWEEPVDPPERRTVYFDRTRPAARGRRCDLIARIDGGRRYRVRIVRAKPGERRVRIVSPLWFAPAVPDHLRLL